jgi:transcriptional regulator with XRE-family HTH domain
MDSQQIRETLDSRRRERKLTQAKLGQLSEIAREDISRFFGGKDIPLRRFLRLCAALGLEVELRPASGRPTADDLSSIYKDE